MKKLEVHERNQQNENNKREEVKEKQTDQNNDLLSNFRSETRNLNKSNKLNNENEPQKQNYKDFMFDEF